MCSSDLLDLVSAVVAEQSEQIADLYRTRNTLARPADPRPDPSELTAPIKSVSSVNVEGVSVGGVSIPYDGRNWTVVGGTWGWIDNPPMARQFHSRVSRDYASADAVHGQILRFLDDYRDGVWQFIRRQILTPPEDATDQQVQVYQDAEKRLRDQGFGQRFAHAQWSSAVNNWRTAVLRQMGDDPQHVLITYDRYDIPGWARQGVFNDAYRHVYNDVYNRNYHRLYRAYFRLTENRLYAQYVQEGMSPLVARQRARAAAAAPADAMARTVAAAGAVIIAQQAATRWINRTWPYEIRPPEQPVPPAAGLSDDERFAYFTVTAGAATTSEIEPRPTLPRILGVEPRAMAAYAQAENFNWMEYDGAYGGGDRYDRRMPPRPWRVSTPGGWNWQPRLAFSDALNLTVPAHVGLTELLREGGVESADPAAFDVLNRH